MDTINVNRHSTNTVATGLEAVGAASQRGGGAAPNRNRQQPQRAQLTTVGSLNARAGRDFTYKDIKNLITMTTPFQPTSGNGGGVGNNKFLAGGSSSSSSKPVAAIIDSKEIRKQLKLKQGKQSLKAYQQQSINTTACLVSSNNNNSSSSSTSNNANNSSTSSSGTAANNSNNQKTSSQYMMNFNGIAPPSGSNMNGKNGGPTSTSFSRAVNLNKTDNLFPLRHNPFFSNSSYSRASLSTITMTYSSLGLSNPTAATAGDNLLMNALNKPILIQQSTPLTRPLSSPMKQSAGSKMSPSRSPSPAKATKLDSGRSRLLFSRSASIMSTIDPFNKPLVAASNNRIDQAGVEAAEVASLDKQQQQQRKVESHPILRNGFMRPQIISNDSKLATTRLVDLDDSSSTVNNNRASTTMQQQHYNHNHESPVKQATPGNQAFADKKQPQVFQPEQSKTAVVVTNNKAENRTINSLLDSSKAREAFFAKLKNAETFNRQFNNENSTTSATSSTSSSSSLSTSPSSASSLAISSSASESSDSSQSDSSSTCSSGSNGAKNSQEEHKNSSSNPAIDSTSTIGGGGTVLVAGKTLDKEDVAKRLFQNQHRPFDLKTNFNNVVKIDTKFTKREPSFIAPVLPAALTINGPMIKELKNRLESLNVSIQNQKSQAQAAYDDSDGGESHMSNYQRVALSEASLKRHAEKQANAEANIKKKQEIQKEALRSLLSKRRHSAATNASRTTVASKSVEPLNNKSNGGVEPSEMLKVYFPDKMKPLAPTKVISESSLKKIEIAQKPIEVKSSEIQKSSEFIDSPEAEDEDADDGGMEDYDVDNDDDGDDDLMGGTDELDDIDGNLSDEMDSTKMEMTLRKQADESRLVSEKEDNEETMVDMAGTDDEDDDDEMTSCGGESSNNMSFSDYLSKFGFDYRSLLTIQTKRAEDGTYTKYKPPLVLSLFNNVPPTINFVTIDEKLQEMPVNLRKLCKWKMCSITPNIVKSTLSRSNFSLASSKNEWIGIWGSHMKPEGFRSIKEYQKINHFPGSFQIGRKDRLCRNLYSAQAQFGKNEYNFVPVTYVLPSDYQLLKNEIESTTNKNSKWIIKPCASARGQGIKLVSKLDQIPKKRGCVVQRYLSNPYLIDGLKFDLRIYVYVTSFDPLRIYLFNDGLTRFASRKYSNSVKTISDKFMHLTNYSINKSNKEYKSNDDENACYGHKWSLKALWLYLQKKNINTEKIWENITDLVVKTIICADPHVNVLVKGNVKRKYSVHELFGFDVILDENLKPWIVEVNISPSLHSNSPLDVSIKGQMISDLLNLAGFMLPNPKEIAKLEGRKCSKKLPKLLLYDKKIQPQQLSNDEKAKHHYFIQRSRDEKTLKTITDVITPDDLRILIESEDEFNRRGSFTRVFPATDSKKYLKFFDTTRYYNLLLTEWIDKFKNSPERGISILNYHCKRRVHLQNPAEYTENQWSHHQGKSSVGHSFDGGDHKNSS